MFAFAAFAIGTIVQEFVRGVRARKAMTGERAPLAFVTLIRRNRRRYGGYTVHFGMAVLFIGVAASSAFQHVHTVQLKKGQSTEIGRGYTARYDGPTSRIDVDADGVERLVFGAKLTVSKKDKKVAVLKPERGYYPIEGAPFAGAVGRYFDGESTSEIAMKAGLGLDIWSAVTPDLDPTLAIVKKGDAVFKQASGKLSAQDYSTALGTTIRSLTDNYAKSAPPATFRLIVSPMVTWIWLGALLVFLGGLICIWPTADLAHRRATAGYAARVARELGRARRSARSRAPDGRRWRWLGCWWRQARPGGRSPARCVAAARRPRTPSTSRSWRISRPPRRRATARSARPRWTSAPASSPKRTTRRSTASCAPRPSSCCAA